MTWAALHNNCEPLIVALQRMNRSFSLCGIIPFEHKITGLEDINLLKPTIFYGSTLLPILAKNLNCNAGIWYDESW